MPCDDLQVSNTQSISCVTCHISHLLCTYFRVFEFLVIVLYSLYWLNKISYNSVLIPKYGSEQIRETYESASHVGCYVSSEDAVVGSFKVTAYVNGNCFVSRKVENNNYVYVDPISGYRSKWLWLGRVSRDQRYR